MDLNPIVSLELKNILGKYNLIIKIIINRSIVKFSDFDFLDTSNTKDLYLCDDGEKIFNKLANIDSPISQIPPMI